MFFFSSLLPSFFFLPPSATILKIKFVRHSIEVKDPMLQYGFVSEKVSRRAALRSGLISEQLNAWWYPIAMTIIDDYNLRYG